MQFVVSQLMFVCLQWVSSRVCWCFCVHASLFFPCWSSGVQTSLISQCINMQTVWSTQQHKVKHAWREEREREKRLRHCQELRFFPPRHCIHYYGRCWMLRELLACDMLSVYHCDRLSNWPTVLGKSGRLLFALFRFVYALHSAENAFYFCRFGFILLGLFLNSVSVRRHSTCCLLHYL